VSLDVAQLLQFAPHGGLIERDRKLVMDPLHQIDQPPAHHAMDRRDRTSLDSLHKRPALGIIEPGLGAGSLLPSTRSSGHGHGTGPPNPARSARPRRRSAPLQSGCHHRKSRPRPRAAAPDSRSRVSDCANRLKTGPSKSSRKLADPIGNHPPKKGAIDSDGKTCFPLSSRLLLTSRSLRRTRDASEPQDAGLRSG
jgi:hypothetical protein